MEGWVNVLRLQAVREQAQAIQALGRARPRDCTLLAIKAAALAVGVALLAAWNARTPVARETTNCEAGIAMRYPWSWHEGFDTELLVEACEFPYDASRSAIEAPQRGCSAVLSRLAWSDFERLSGLESGRRPGPGWRSDLGQIAAEVAAHLRLRGQMEVVGSAQLGGRPAVVVRGCRLGGYAVVAVAPGLDVALFLFHAPDERTLDMARPTWMAMIRAARLIGPGPTAPVPQRPSSLIPPEAAY